MELALVFPPIAVFVLFFSVLSGLFGRTADIDRLKKYTDRNEIGKEEAPKKSGSYKSGLGFLARSIEKLGLFYRYKENMRKMLVKANLLLKPEEMVSIGLVSFVAGGALGFLLTQSILFVVMLAFAGMNLPGIFLKKRIKKRIKTINGQLGDTISILSNSLKAGHSFFQAVDSVVNEMKGPISEEFAKLLKEINLGGSTEGALENMVERVGSDDVELMVTAVLIQRQIGGNLAEILDNISNTIRQRVKMKGEIKTLTAQGRMSGIVISLLPVGLAMMMAVISPDQFKMLFTEPIGIVMIGMAVVMEFIGYFFIRKIVNIEV
ncbi:MAG: type II secretion system F family protein [Thermoclostridium sp.]|nr:type II secretion system F family protein [Thermoclostridium sp.]